MYLADHWPWLLSSVLALALVGCEDLELALPGEPAGAAGQAASRAGQGGAGGDATGGTGQGGGGRAGAAGHEAAPTALKTGSFTISGEISTCDGVTNHDWPYGGELRLDILDQGPALVIWGETGAFLQGAGVFDPQAVFSPRCQASSSGPLSLSLWMDGNWNFALDETGAPTAIQVAWGGWVKSCNPQLSSLSFAGKVVPDTRAPRFVFADHAFHGVSLPWGDREIHASEGIRVADWGPRITATIGGLPVSLSPGAVAAGQSNVMRLVGADWVQSGGKSLHVAMDAVADPSGNVGTGLESEVMLAVVGEAQPALTFEKDPAFLLVGFEVRPAGDAACEAGMACAVAHEPSAPSAVVAGRVALAGATAIRVRYAAPPGAAIDVQLASPDGTTTTSTYSPSLYWSSSQEEESSWSSILVPVPPGLSEVGVAVAPTVVTALYSFCPGSRPSFEFVVGSIAAE